MLVNEITKRTYLVLQHLAATNRRLVTAESCTGGLLSSYLTDISGSSAVFDRGYITYSNQAKVDLLNVSRALLETVGAVSSDVAEAMAVGALSRCDAHVAISITGIAGPKGDTLTKPIGLIYFGLAVIDHHVRHWKSTFSGDRHTIRNAAVVKALDILLEA